jgi:hypothetical protein
MMGSEYFSQTVNYDPTPDTPPGTPTTTVGVSPFLGQVHVDLYGEGDDGHAWGWHYTIQEAIRLRDTLNRAIQAAQILQTQRNVEELARTQEDQRYARELEDELQEAQNQAGDVNPWEQ